MKPMQIFLESLQYFTTMMQHTNTQLTISVLLLLGGSGTGKTLITEIFENQLEIKVTNLFHVISSGKCEISEQYSSSFIIPIN